MTTTEQITQELAALRQTVADLVQAIGPRITREQLCKRRNCHRNTLGHLIDRGVVPRPDTSGKFLLAEVIEFEAMERAQRRAA